jgi:23S rRNA pseudouridine2605 synthase
MIIRLNKFLAQAGLASRREADRIIAEGRVKVNGLYIDTQGCKVDELKDEVEVDGVRVKNSESMVYFMLNKPRGYLVTMNDPLNRATIVDLLPKLKERVFPVGRLDRDSEGLLLVTNDGFLSNRLIHPRYEMEKEYIVVVTGRPKKVDLKRLEKGVSLDGRQTAPARILVVSSGPSWSTLRFIIHEGRKREIRRMVELIDHKVLKLKRVKFAGLELKGLKSSHWRRLTGAEISHLKTKVGI